MQANKTARMGTIKLLAARLLLPLLQFSMFIFWNTEKKNKNKKYIQNQHRHRDIARFFLSAWKWI